MKVWIISLFGLFVFLILGFSIQSYLYDSADFLNQKLAKVEPDLENNNWEPALMKLKSLENAWAKTKPIWAVLINHKEMDLIEETLNKTIKAVFCKSYTDALINLSVLRDFIRHIPEKERFSMVNIF